MEAGDGGGRDGERGGGVAMDSRFILVCRARGGLKLGRMGLAGVANAGDEDGMAGFESCLGVLGGSRDSVEAMSAAKWQNDHRLPRCRSASTTAPALSMSAVLG